MTDQEILIYLQAFERSELLDREVIDELVELGLLDVLKGEAFSYALSEKAKQIVYACDLNILKLKNFRRQTRLDGLHWKALRDEGRK